MKWFGKLVFVFLLLTLLSCATNDFKVVEALKKGMTQPEVKEFIASYGFMIEQSLERPKSGWADIEGSFVDLSSRAKRFEDESKLIVSRAEYYPVTHGMFGFGQLFVFYDVEGKLVYYYRRQVN